MGRNTRESPSHEKDHEIDDDEDDIDDNTTSEKMMGTIYGDGDDDGYGYSDEHYDQDEDGRDANSQVMQKSESSKIFAEFSLCKMFGPL